MARGRPIFKLLMYLSSTNLLNFYTNYIIGITKPVVNFLLIEGNFVHYWKQIPKVSLNTLRDTFYLFI